MQRQNQVSMELPAYKTQKMFATLPSSTFQNGSSFYSNTHHFGQFPHQRYSHQENDLPSDDDEKNIAILQKQQQYTIFYINQQKKHQQLSEFIKQKLARKKLALYAKQQEVKAQKQRVIRKKEKYEKLKRKMKRERQRDEDRFKGDLRNLKNRIQELSNDLSHISQRNRKIEDRRWESRRHRQQLPIFIIPMPQMPYAQYPQQIVPQQPFVEQSNTQSMMQQRPSTNNQFMNTVSEALMQQMGGGKNKTSERKSSINSVQTAKQLNFLPQSSNKLANQWERDGEEREFVEALSSVNSVNEKKNSQPIIKILESQKKVEKSEKSAEPNATPFDQSKVAIDIQDSGKKDLFLSPLKIQNNQNFGKEQVQSRDDLKIQDDKSSKTFERKRPYPIPVTNNKTQSKYEAKNFSSPVKLKKVDSHMNPEQLLLSQNSKKFKTNQSQDDIYGNDGLDGLNLLTSNISQMKKDMKKEQNKQKISSIIEEEDIQLDPENIKKSQFPMPLQNSNFHVTSNDQTVKKEESIPPEKKSINRKRKVSASENLNLIRKGTIDSLGSDFEDDIFNDIKKINLSAVSKISKEKNHKKSSSIRESKQPINLSLRKEEKAPEANRLTFPKDKEVQVNQYASR